MRILISFCFLASSLLLFGQSSRLVLPIGHTKAISCIAVSADNKRILSGSEDGTLRLWDVNSGKELMVYEGHFGSITQLSFIQNDQRFVSTAEDNSLKVWEVKTGSLLFNIDGHSEKINRFAISPDESLVATVSMDRLTTISRLSDGKLLSSNEYFDWGAEQIAFDSTGTRILTFDDNRFIIQSIPGDTLQLDVAMSIQQMLKIPSSNKVALSFFMSKHFYILDFTQDKFMKLESQFAEIQGMSVSHSGKMLITTNRKDSLEIWNTSDNSKRFDLVVEFNGENNIRHIEFNADDSKIFITDYEGKTKVYSSVDGVEIYSFSDAVATECLSFPKNSDFFVAGLRDNSIQLRNVKDGSLKQRILGKSNSVMQMYPVDSSEIMLALVVSAQKNSIMTEGGDFRLVGTEKNSGKLVYQLGISTENLDRFKENELYFLLYDNKGLLTVYDRNNGEKQLERQMNLNGFVDIYFNEQMKDLLEIYYSNGRIVQIDCKKNTRSEFLLAQVKLKRLLPIENSHKIWCVDSMNTLTLIDRLGGAILFKETFGKKEEIAFIHGNSSSFLVVGTKKMKFYQETSQGFKSVPVKFKRIAEEPHKLYSENDELVDVRDFVFNDAQLNSSGTILKIRLDHKSVQFFDVQNGSFLREMVIDAFSEESISYCTFIDDKICHFVPLSNDSGDKIRLESNLQQFKLIYENVINPKEEVSLEGHTYVGTDTKSSKNSNFFITSAWDGTSIYWSKQNGKKLATTMILNDNNWITFLPSGHYYSSKDASKYLHYVDNELNIITFEQLDAKFNRPDLVLKVINPTDTLHINSFYNAYLKRLKRLNIDTSSLHDGYSVPQLSIVNREELLADLKGNTIALHLLGYDRNTSLERFNIWMNEIPIYGERGISLQNKKSMSFDTTIIIQLTEGRNRIETSVTNSSAIESFRSPIYVNYTPEKPYIPKTHFIGIGIDKFQEPEHDLSYSVKDVRDLAKAMKAKLGDQLTIDTLFNQNVSISNVQALKKRLLETNINDKVIISYSGHGLLSKEYDYYLSSYTVNFHQPEIGGIPYEVLEDLLDSIPARQKLLLIDACHSGEVDKDDFREMAAVAGAKGLVQPKGAGAENTSTTNTVGLQNSFQLMQELFVNVQKGSGATIISAAAGDQFALEGGKLENGFFTYAILQYIANNQSVGINELKKYVYAEVERLSGGLQKPTSRIENLELDWRMW